MGGALALRATSLYPDLINGLVSSVPAGDRFHQMGDSIKIGLKLVTGANKEMNVAPIVVNRSTVKEELREQWLKDPLARFQLSPAELVQFQRFMDENHKSARKITSTPVLMLQGTKDTLVKHEGNETLINEIPCKDSVLVFVDSKEHLILEEGQFDNQVIDTICGWLDDHSRQRLGSKDN
jgi:alpha-beta hydrolase superfamily lysophospholipase